MKNEGFKLHDGHKATANHPKVYHCGDVMFDNSLYFSTISDQNSTILDQIGIEKNKYILTTIHRDSNTDIAENMEQIFLLCMKFKKILVLILFYQFTRELKVK